jgi:hypothetical protein
LVAFSNDHEGAARLRPYVHKGNFSRSVRLDCTACRIRQTIAVSTHDTPPIDDDPVLREALKRCSLSHLLARLQIQDHAPQRGSAPRHPQASSSGSWSANSDRSSPVTAIRCAYGGPRARFAHTMEVVMMAEEVIAVSVCERTQHLRTLVTFPRVLCGEARRSAAGRSKKPRTSCPDSHWDLKRRRRCAPHRSRGAHPAPHSPVDLIQNHASIARYAAHQRSSRLVVFRVAGWPVGKISQLTPISAGSSLLFNCWISIRKPGKDRLAQMSAIPGATMQTAYPEPAIRRRSSVENAGAAHAGIPPGFRTSLVNCALSCPSSSPPRAGGSARPARHHVDSEG